MNIIETALARTFYESNICSEELVDKVRCYMRDRYMLYSGIPNDTIEMRTFCMYVIGVGYTSGFCNGVESDDSYRSKMYREIYEEFLSQSNAGIEDAFDQPGYAEAVREHKGETADETFIDLGMFLNSLEDGIEQSLVPRDLVMPIAANAFMDGHIDGEAAYADGLSRGDLVDADEVVDIALSDINHLSPFDHARVVALFGKSKGDEQDEALDSMLSWFVDGGINAAVDYAKSDLNDSTGIVLSSDTESSHRIGLFVDSYIDGVIAYATDEELEVPNRSYDGIAAQIDDVEEWCEEHGYSAECKDMAVANIKSIYVEDENDDCGYDDGGYDEPDDITLGIIGIGFSAGWDTAEKHGFKTEEGYFERLDEELDEAGLAGLLEDASSVSGDSELDEAWNAYSTHIGPIVDGDEKIPDGVFSFERDEYGDPYFVFAGGMKVVKKMSMDYIAGMADFEALPKAPEDAPSPLKRLTESLDADGSIRNLYNTLMELSLESCRIAFPAESYLELVRFFDSRYGADSVAKGEILYQGSGIQPRILRIGYNAEEKLASRD
jgi:hypothetical protein